MAGIFTDYWRIVKPSPTKSQYVTASSEAAKLYSNFSWYTKVMKGASSRFSKYTQYKNMDSDVFVSRALDTIAEEMTQLNARTSLPFEIDYQNENNVEVPENITMTVRAALRHWCDIQELHTTLFDIARYTIKFGDCFFQKTSDFKRWKYIDQSDIIGITISEDGKAEYYHVREGEKNKQGAFGDVTLIPAAGMVHFSLTSSMGESGPFGESPLWACLKSFRHLSLLEDSVIIYRIVRAPERRVFFVDVGNMPPQRVKAYLESIKNEMKQKRIPNEAGGQEQIDSVYNPMSMCLDLSTRIPLLDGRTLALTELIEEHNSGKTNWVYSCDPITGKVVPGIISWAGVTRKNAERMEIILDNGSVLVCTPDHQIPVLGRGFVRADQLSTSDSLISFERKLVSLNGGNEYEQVFDHETNEWKWTHHLVSKFMDEQGEINEFRYKHVGEIKQGKVIHHADFDRFNNSPENLKAMAYSDHFKYHSDHGGFKGNQCLRSSPELFDLFKQIVLQSDFKRTTVLRLASEDLKFMNLYRELNQPDGSKKNHKINLQKINEKFLKLIYRENNFVNWKHLVRSFQEFKQDDYGSTDRGVNVTREMVYKITSVRFLDERKDVGCITVDKDGKYHNYHTFATESGIFVKNSEDYFFAQTAEGRGSRVETLSGGENLGEIADLTYFQNKFLQGLRIPSSYMRGGDAGGSQITDGKVGIAYIEELRFANFVARLQSKINNTFDAQFKCYLKSAGIKIDNHLFKIKLVDPQNFLKYKQAEVDEKMISNFSNLKDVNFLSNRFKLMHFLGLSEDEVQENEAMLKQELAIPDTGIDESLTDIRMMYDPKWLEGRPDIKVAETYDDHTAATTIEGESSPKSSTEDTADETADETDTETSGSKKDLASNSKEKKTEPESEKGGEEKTPSLDDIENQLK